MAYIYLYVLQLIYCITCKLGDKLTVIPVLMIENPRKANLRDRDTGTDNKCRSCKRYGLGIQIISSVPDGRLYNTNLRNIFLV